MIALIIGVVSLFFGIYFDIVALNVIGGIFLFFGILFSVHENVTIDMKDEMAVTLRILGIPIKLAPGKPKKPADPKKLEKKLAGKYTLKAIRKRDEKAAKAAAKKAADKAKKKQEKAEKEQKKAEELAKLTPEERKRLKEEKKAKQPDLFDLIGLICRVAGLFFSRFFGKIRITVDRLNIRIGASDAMSSAITFALVNQGVQYMFLFLDKIAQLRGLKRAEISVAPDFASQDFALDCRVTVRVSLGGILGAVFKAGFAFLFGFIRIKPDGKHPKKSVFPEMPQLPPSPFTHQVKNPVEDTDGRQDAAEETQPDEAVTEPSQAVSA